MPTIADIASTGGECIAYAAVNHGVSMLIAPFVGPVGAAVAPKICAAAAQTITTSAASSLITYGIFSGAKVALNQEDEAYNTQENSKENSKPFNEEWDDAGVKIDMPI
tara:strand:+ start:1476 stop:1799 length:324 start_codon:yes stop_codon:yes gene_type:complete